MGYRPIAATAACFGLLLLLSSCGGGGGSSPVQVGSQGDCEQLIKSGYTGQLDFGQGEGSAGGGGGIGAGGDGEGGVGIGGALGQFRGALVVVSDGTGRKIGEALTDEARGMVTIRLCNYAGPVLAEIQGRDGATYFDESTGKAEPFGLGRRLRVKVATVTSNLGITPYTEAAVQLMDAQGAGMEAGKIAAANERIGRVLSDQVPGIYRPNGSVGAPIDITRLPIVLNASNAGVAGTLTDTRQGQYGAINAGFSRSAGTFLPGDPTPTLTATLQFAADLADGRLDMQGIDGPVAAVAPPAYTYETLWRSKTVAAGLTAQVAGDDLLKAKNAPVNEYNFGASATYQSCSYATGTCTPLLRRTEVTQTVRLDAKGVLTLRRALTATLGPQLRFVTEKHEAVIPGVFVDVRIGNQGEVVALMQDRRTLRYIDPVELYQVTGREPLVDNVDTTGVVKAAVTRVDTVTLDPTSGRAGLRIVDYTVSPLPRIYRSGAAGLPPAVLVVMSDGALRAIAPNGLTGSFAVRWAAPQLTDMPTPEPLLGVAYDKFVPPAYDPAYGAAPATETRLPWRGPRRLFGLTRKGEVKVWLEGEAAAGKRLAIPGKVVQISADAKASVFALTADGKVYWINADQAHEANAGATLIDRPLAQFPRRFPLDHVEPVFAKTDKPVCWLAQTVAVVCETGEVVRWSEIPATLQGAADSNFVVCGASTASVSSNSALIDNAYVSGGLTAPVLVPISAGVGPIWRVNSVQEFQFSRQGDFRQSCRIDGMRFIGVSGQTVDAGTLEGRRNIATEERAFPDGNGGSFQSTYLTGLQLRTALESVMSLLGSSAQPASVPSSGPTGLVGLLQVGTGGESSGFSHFSAVRSQSGQAIDVRPAIRFGGSLTVSGGTSAMQLRTISDETNRRLALPLQGVRPSGDVRTWNDSDLIPLNRAIKEWEFVDPLATCGTGCRDERQQFNLWQVMLIGVNNRDDPYAFDLCFRIRIELRAAADIRFVCSRHDDRGAYKAFNLTDRVLRPDGLLDLVDFFNL